MVVIFRKAESREPSPEPASYHKATDELDQSASATVPSAGVLAGDTVDVDEGHFQLPEPPDLVAFVPSDTAWPAEDRERQLLEDSWVESENADVDANESEPMVHLIFTVLDLTYPSGVWFCNMLTAPLHSLDMIMLTLGVR